MSDIVIRAATAADDADVLALLQRSLGWRPDDPMAEFFDWKHRQSPFGVSPSWVAVHGTRVVGFRTFMRWAFDVDGRVVRAVRAVDTATDPEYQGRGIFRDLTLSALEELTGEGVAFVFNTPNDQSRPGYLKMGWQPVGRLPMHTRVALSPRAALRTVRAGVPAERWSQPLDVGDAPTPGAWADAGQDAHDGLLRTSATPDVLQWRYGTPLLRYRVLPSAGGPVVVRTRRRGAAVELAVVHRPAGGRVPRRRAVMRAAGADYAVALGRHRPAGFVTLRSRGPLLTARRLTEEPPPAGRWDLQLGDVELF